MDNDNTIGQIAVPNGFKPNWDDYQFVKNVPKIPSFCEVKIVKKGEEKYAIKTIHKD